MTGATTSCAWPEERHQPSKWNAIRWSLAFVAVLDYFWNRGADHLISAEALWYLGLKKPVQPLSRPVIRVSAHHLGQWDVQLWHHFLDRYIYSLYFVSLNEYHGFGLMHQGMSMSLDSTASTVMKADPLTFILGACQTGQHLCGYVSPYRKQLFAVEVLYLGHQPRSESFALLSLHVHFDFVLFQSRNIEAGLMFFA